MDVMEHRACVDLALQVHEGDAAAAAETCRRAADWWATVDEGRHRHRAAVWRAVAEHLEHLMQATPLRRRRNHMQATPEQKQIREFLRQYVNGDSTQKGLLASAYRFFTGKDIPVADTDTVEALASITGATAYGWDLAAAVESVLETAFGTEALEVVAVYLAYLLGVVPVPWEEV